MNKVTFIYCILLSYTTFSQELKFEGETYSEKPIYDDSNEHRYTIDNISYTLNSTFTFDYFYQDSLGNEYKFERNESYSDENPLNLIPNEKITPTTIDKIQITIDDPLSVFYSYDSTYTQTVLAYNYLDSSHNPNDTICNYLKRMYPEKNYSCADEHTGVIDNRKNVWIHPPRQFTFKILQLCPYPFQFLDKNENQWSWEFSTGGFYLDPRWIDAKERIKIKYKYQRLPQEKINTKLGKLDCLVTKGVGTSDFKPDKFRTELISYFNQKYGFVRLEYTLINGDKLVMKLVESSKL